MSRQRRGTHERGTYAGGRIISGEPTPGLWTRLRAEAEAWKVSAHELADNAERDAAEIAALREENEALKRDIAGRPGDADMNDHPGCMMPDGAEPCPQYTALLAERDRLRAEVERLKHALCECAGQRVALNAEKAELVVEAIKLLNSAFGEYTCAASKYLPDEEKAKFEANFAVPARQFIHRAALAKATTTEGTS